MIPLFDLSHIRRKQKQKVKHLGVFPSLPVHFEAGKAAYETTFKVEGYSNVDYLVDRSDEAYASAELALKSWIQKLNQKFSGERFWLVEAPPPLEQGKRIDGRWRRPLFSFTIGSTIPVRDYATFDHSLLKSRCSITIYGDKSQIFSSPFLYAKGHGIRQPLAGWKFHTPCLPPEAAL